MSKIKKLINPLLILFLLGTVQPVFSHPGHGDEFNHETNTTTTNKTLEVESNTAEQIGIKVEAIERRQWETGIKTTGQLETLFDQQVEIRTPTAGTVVELLVQPGDKIAKGQPLAVISSLELLELRVESLDRQTEAKTDLDKALANLELAQQDLARQKQIAEAQITSARTEFTVAQERYQRDLELEQAGALSRREMLESKAQLAHAQSSLQQALSRREVIQAEAELKRSVSGVEAAQNHLSLSDRTYQTRLQQLNSPATEKGLVTIYAPISGVVAHREVTLGESFDEAGGKLMTMVNNRQIWATANIYEKDLLKVKVGQQVNVRVAGLEEQVFTARVAQIDPVVDGTTRIISVRSLIDNPEDILKPGMFAELEILTTQTAQPILAIPQTAIIEANGQQFIYIQNSSSNYQPVEVTLGESFSDWVEVNRGLFPGDLVVVQGANMLYAQSLRGGSKNQSDDASTPDPTTTSQEINPWLFTVIGTVIGLGAFCLGKFSNKPKTPSFPLVTEINPEE